MQFQIQTKRLMLLWSIDNLLHDWELTDEESTEKIKEILKVNADLLIADEIDDNALRSIDDA